VQALDILTDEHRTVESILDSLCLFAASVRDNPSDERATLLQFVELLRIFDKLHHMKEEDMLFEKMTEHGFPRDQGPLAVMLADHGTCRGLVAEMDALATQSQPWSTDECGRLATTAERYTLFLKSHIGKEDNVLYPMSRQQLPEASWELLDQAFAEFNELWQREGRLDDFRARVDALRQAWPAESGPTPMGGCGQ